MQVLDLPACKTFVEVSNCGKKIYQNIFQSISLEINALFGENN